MQRDAMPRKARQWEETREQAALKENLYKGIGRMASSASSEQAEHRAIKQKQPKVRH